MWLCLIILGHSADCVSPIHLLQDVCDCVSSSLDIVLTMFHLFVCAWSCLIILGHGADRVSPIHLFQAVRDHASSSLNLVLTVFLPFIFFRLCKICLILELVLTMYPFRWCMIVSSPTNVLLTEPHWTSPYVTILCCTMLCWWALCLAFIIISDGSWHLSYLKITLIDFPSFSSGSKWMHSKILQPAVESPANGFNVSRQCVKFNSYNTCTDVNAAALP